MVTTVKPAREARVGDCVLYKNVFSTVTNVSAVEGQPDKVMLRIETWYRIERKAKLDKPDSYDRWFPADELLEFDCAHSANRSEANNLNEQKAEGEVKKR